MRVAVEVRIGPDFESCLIGTEAGERHRGRDVDVGRESLRALARRTLEDLRRLAEGFEIDALFHDVRRTEEPPHRLARDHAHRVDLAFGGGVHGVEADQRAGRHGDLTTVLFRDVDEVPIGQKRTGTEHDGRLAARNERLDDPAKDRGGRAFDDNVRFRFECRNRHHLRLALEIVDFRARLVRIADRDGGERKPGNALIERLHHLEPDRAEARDRNALRLPCFDHLGILIYHHGAKRSGTELTAGIL